ncbi:MAG TPA: ribosomal L7Ae/L30e/S12e/Gadd45 family protein [Longimicrobiales bacterium]|nr:ribosomal L7Ae/L30e/S12e/Gadd45 family protein [Longimicrobiales bacterium]
MRRPNRATRRKKTSPDPALQLLGLATRAGATVPGTERVKDVVRSGGARLVLVASDLTATGLDKLVPLLEGRDVPYVVGYTRDELGTAVGRGPLAAVAVTQEGFADRLKALLDPSGDAT